MNNTAPLFQTLAGLVGAYHRCCSPDANESQKGWAAHHRDKCLAVVKDYMPSGSGVDSGTKLDLDASTDEKLVFDTSFHHMNDGGMYDGWTEHTVTVTPSLWNRIKIRISGRDRNDIKDYLHEIFHDALTQEIER